MRFDERRCGSGPGVGKDVSVQNHPLAVGQLDHRGGKRRFDHVILEDEPPVMRGATVFPEVDRAVIPRAPGVFFDRAVRDQRVAAGNVRAVFAVHQIDLPVGGVVDRAVRNGDPMNAALHVMPGRRAGDLRVLDRHAVAAEVQIVIVSGLFRRAVFRDAAVGHELIGALGFHALPTGAAVAHDPHVVAVNVAPGDRHVVGLSDPHARGVMRVVVRAAKDETVERAAGSISAKLNDRPGGGTGAGVVDARPVQRDRLVRVGRLNGQIRLGDHQLDLFIRLAVGQRVHDDPGPGRRRLKSVFDSGKGLTRPDVQRLAERTRSKQDGQQKKQTFHGSFQPFNRFLVLDFSVKEMTGKYTTYNILAG